MMGREPVAIVNAARLSFLAAMTFGLPLTDTQLVASMVALEAVLTLLQRSQVSPNAVVEAALTLPKGSTMAQAVAESKRPEEPVEQRA